LGVRFGIFDAATWVKGCWPSRLIFLWVLVWLTWCAACALWASYESPLIALQGEKGLGLLVGQVLFFPTSAPTNRGEGGEKGDLGEKGG